MKGQMRVHLQGMLAAAAVGGAYLCSRGPRVRGTAGIFDLHRASSGRLAAHSRDSAAPRSGAPRGPPPERPHGRRGARSPATSTKSRRTRPRGNLVAARVGGMGKERNGQRRPRHAQRLRGLRPRDARRSPRPEPLVVQRSVAGRRGDGATAAGVSYPVPLADFPSEAMRRLLRAHRDAFKNKETLGPAWMPRSLDDDVGALSVSSVLSLCLGASRSELPLSLSYYSSESRRRRERRAPFAAGSRRRRGCHVDISWRRVAATSRLPRVYSVERRARAPAVSFQFH